MSDNNQQTNVREVEIDIDALFSGAPGADSITHPNEQEKKPSIFSSETITATVSGGWCFGMFNAIATYGTSQNYTASVPVIVSTPVAYCNNTETLTVSSIVFAGSTAGVMIKPGTVITIEQEA
jgi:hypothetical protein